MAIDGSARTTDGQAFGVRGVDDLDPAWDSRWDLGDDTIPAARFTSAAFQALEYERLWSRVWQVACREEEIPEPGDYVEYMIGSESIIVVRGDDESIRAFYNSCRHRSTRLATGCGTFAGGQIRCPFHGWRYNLDGSSSHVPERHEFVDEGMAPEDLALIEPHIAIWGGFVFVNLDDDPPPLEDYLGTMGPMLGALNMEDMRFRWYKTAIVDANWKVTLDGFTESYHVAATHPQLGVSGALANYFPQPGGHLTTRTGRLVEVDKYQEALGDDLDPREVMYQQFAAISEQLDAIYLPRDVQIAQSLVHSELPEGVSAPEKYYEALEAYVEGAGIPQPKLTLDQRAVLGSINFIFPNFMVLPGFANALVYRLRPNGDDPNSAVFDVWSIAMFPEGEEPDGIDRQVLDWADREAWRTILWQDFGNLINVTIGLHSRGSRGYKLSGRQEVGILHMNQEIDRYLKS